ncbi:family 78 glycoside hydrolase catalytic domain [Nesterenkonia sp. CF4.4]|uniref:alpha-L-rhamnosidase n=1 Tax=Nesterenkonia sp. CF4.4 TaxID=3373079 RepID=UPI003EE61F20
MKTPTDDWDQTQVEVRLDGTETVTLSGPQHLFVEWPFQAALEPYRLHLVELRVRDAGAVWSPWSAPVRVELGAAPEGSWKAGFIGVPEPSRPAQPFKARTGVSVDKPLERAILHLTALGAVRARIDGQVVTDAALSPGWTTYRERVLTDTLDVTEHFDVGRHTLQLEATGAWYTEEYGFGASAHRIYGDQPSVSAQLELIHQDGTSQTIVTDAEWEVCAEWEIIDSGIYAGETIDHRRTGCADADWVHAKAVETSAAVVPRTSDPVREVLTLEPVTATRTAPDTVLLDFGQNFAGRLRLRVAGPRGTEITVRHAEVLEDGRLALEPLRRAAARDTFVLSGEGEELFEPFGTFHGFRYAEISGWPGNFDLDAIRGVVLSTDMKRTGWFECSEPLLNRLHENVLWSTRSNFLSVPSDCPQRDERMGWTGDVAVFTPTARTLFDCESFLRSWLVDLESEQRKWGGVVPFVVPDVLGFPPGPAAGWGDAAVLVPWALFERGADPSVLTQQYSSMKSWVDAVTARSEGSLWKGDLQFGDWLDPTAPPERPGAARADRDLVATAYWFRSTGLLAEIAERLGFEEDASKYRTLAAEIRAAFLQEYLTPSGRMVSDAPTAYVLAITFNLVTEPDRRRRLGEFLVECIRRDSYHIGTGFLGTPHLLDALADTGHADVAERLLLQTENPSWLYPVTMGATTVWERWDSLLEDGSVNPGEMTSFNHYALGAVVDWLYRRLAGVAPAAPGYKQIRFAPALTSRIDRASAVLDTPAGRVRGGWRREADIVVLSLLVPEHATATVALPAMDEFTIGPGQHEWRIEAAASGSQPPRVRGEVSLGTPLREIVDDREAYQTVMDALAEFGEAARQFRMTMDWSSSSPLGASLYALPHGAGERIARALGGLSAFRGESPECKRSSG